MPKVTSIRSARSATRNKTLMGQGPDVFTPCSQDMTICGDCEGNRAKNACPRLKEWLAKRKA